MTWVKLEAYLDVADVDQLPGTNPLKIVAALGKSIPGLRYVDDLSIRATYPRKSNHAIPLDGLVDTMDATKITTGSFGGFPGGFPGGGGGGGITATAQGFGGGGGGGGQWPHIPIPYPEDTYRRMGIPTHDMAVPIPRQYSQGAKEDDTRPPKCKRCGRKADLRVNWPDNKHHNETYCTVLHMSQSIGRRKWWAKPQDAQCIREVVVK